MAVGHFSTAIGGPYQTVHGYAKALQESGHPVRVLALRQQGLPEVRPSDSGIRVEHLSLPALIRSSWQLRDRPVVVFGVWHSVFLIFGVLGAMRIGRRRVLVPTQSLSPIDWNKHRRLKWLLRPLVHGMLRRFDLVIFATEGERIVSEPALPKTEVIYHPTTDVMVPPPGAPLSGPRIAFLGRVHPQKDVELFLRTLATLPPAWHADVVGDGSPSYLALVRALAEELGCLSRIRWHGWRPRDEALAIVRGAEVLLVTSLAENYCHAAVEAMKLRVPVVMVDRVAAAIDLKSLELGVATEAKPSALASAILRLHGDELLRARLETNGRAFFEDRISGVDRDRICQAVLGRTTTMS